MRTAYGWTRMSVFGLTLRTTGVAVSKRVILEVRLVVNEYLTHASKLAVDADR